MVWRVEMNTPEELAEQYVHAWWGPREDNMTLATRQAFLAGYHARKQIEEAERAALALEAEKALQAAKARMAERATAWWLKGEK